MWQNAGDNESAVLVVDDDKGMREVIQWTLEDVGLPVHTVAHGREALDWVEHMRPDVVVLDMGLPEMDGYQVAKALRERLGDDLPILVITADGRAAEKARRVGAYDYLHKPFDFDDLVSTIQRGRERNAP